MQFEHLFFQRRHNINIKLRREYIQHNCGSGDLRQRCADGVNRNNVIVSKIIHIFPGTCEFSQEEKDRCNEGNNKEWSSCNVLRSVSKVVLHGARLDTEHKERV